MRGRVGIVVAVGVLVAVFVHPRGTGAVPVASAGSAAPSCWEVPGQVVPERNAAVVPTNARVTMFAAYPGIFTFEADGYTSTVRASTMDDLRTLVVTPDKPLPPNASIRVMLEDTEVTRFRTGKGRDTEPPRAPTISALTVWYTPYQSTPKHLAITAVPTPDTVALVVTTVDKATGKSATVQIPRTGISANASSYCQGFELEAGHETCFHISAVDVAGNTSPEVVKCKVLEKPKDDAPSAPVASSEPVPSSGPAYQHGVDNVVRLDPTDPPDPTPAKPLIGWSILLVLIILGTGLRGAFARAKLSPAATPAPADAVVRIARLLRSRGLALAIGGAIAALAGWFNGSNVVESAWYVGPGACVTVLGLLLLARGHRVLALLARGASPLADAQGRVFIVRDAKPLSWLAATPAMLRNEPPAPTPAPAVDVHPGD